MSWPRRYAVSSGPLSHPRPDQQPPDGPHLQPTAAVGRHWSLILANATVVVAETGFLPARDYPTFALIYGSLPPDNRTERMHRTNGLIGASTQTGNLIAFAAGGFLVASLTVERVSAATAQHRAMLGMLRQSLLPRRVPPHPPRYSEH